MKGFLFFNILILILFSSCVEVPVDKDNVTDSLYSIEKIERAYEDENIALALQNISYLQRKGSPEEIERIPGLLKQGVVLANNKFTKLIDENRFLDAASLLITAKAGNLELDTSFTYQDLVRKALLETDSRYTKGEKVYIARNKLDLKTISDEDLKKILDISREAGDRVYTQIVSAEWLRRSLDEDELLEENREVSSKSDYLKGTVTILVNRGMKIEGGIGLPDRIIGSGFFIDKEGYILTNYHVIESEVDPEFEGFSRLYIHLWDKPDIKIPARVIGWDRTFDIALLKIEVEPEFIFSFSESKDYLPGTPIIAIGSPGGLENTITSGIISAFGRKLLQMGKVMQVDVPINHGNSGGPLIDNEGELAGVVFAGIEQFEGINFAIPGEYLVPLIPALYSGGRLSHPFLGAGIEEVENGLRVIYRFPGANIEKAGIEIDDIITSLNGTGIKSIDDINKIFSKIEPGMAVTIKWLSNGIEKEGVIALGERSDFPLYDVTDIDLKQNLIPPVFGMSVNNISNKIFGNEYIVTEVFPGSIADETGLSVNDPFSIKKWKVLEDEKALIMQIRIKKRKAGFLESGVQMGAYLGTTNVI